MATVSRNTRHKILLLRGRNIMYAYLYAERDYYISYVNNVYFVNTNNSSAVRFQWLSGARARRRFFFSLLNVLLFYFVIHTRVRY